MNKVEFLESFDVAEGSINEGYIEHVLEMSIKTSIEKYGTSRGQHQLIICMEELSEMQKEISKSLRGKGDHVNILEELADICIVQRYIQLLEGIDMEELNKAINVKIRRLHTKLVEDGKFD